ncbi:hypothetical protein GPEL0_01f2659 [Geoanaerobacter pelophilus]|uniref:Uncharacterized protein n=1 Tax=Geoanaerobacter pelophilus TaxID=60036 RepID=A0ABQ0MIY3_9BACT|nr:hypothetical protein GPEL0_01f2659 [Geoanaerobacter pelophilus]
MHRPSRKQFQLLHVISIPVPIYPPFSHPCGPSPAQGSGPQTGGAGRWCYGKAAADGLSQRPRRARGLRS